MIRIAVPLVLAVLLNACTSNMDDFSDIVEVEHEEFAFSTYTQSSGTLKYDYKGAQDLEWFHCGAANANASFLLLSPENMPFTKVEFCKQTIAQGFLSEGFSVYGLNLPGNGSSTGEDDLGGKQSIAAIQAIVTGRIALAPTQPMLGIWAYGTSSVAAFFYSKHVGQVPMLIVGGGIYDLEEVVAKAAPGPFLNLVNHLKQKEGAAFSEARSIAWDPAGLPKKLRLYHAAKDLRFPSESARAFRDSLSTLGYDVYIMIIPEAGHVLGREDHYATLKKLLAEYKASLIKKDE